VFLAMAGCGRRPVLPVGALTSDAVTDEYSYRNFTKVWHYQVDSDTQMNIRSTYSPWLSKCTVFSCDELALQFTDELKQNDGKLVKFECNAVADKIIDRNLVSKVQKACNAIHSTAKDYWMVNNNPSEFTDNNGRIRQRQ